MDSDDPSSDYTEVEPEEDFALTLADFVAPSTAATPAEADAAVANDTGEDGPMDRIPFKVVDMTADPHVSSDEEEEASVVASRLFDRTDAVSLVFPFMTIEELVSTCASVSTWWRDLALREFKARLTEVSKRQAEWITACPQNAHAMLQLTQVRNFADPSNVSAVGWIHLSANPFRSRFSISHLENDGRVLLATPQQSTRSAVWQVTLFDPEQEDPTVFSGIRAYRGPARAVRRLEFLRTPHDALFVDWDEQRLAQVSVHRSDQQAECRLVFRDFDGTYSVQTSELRMPMRQVRRAQFFVTAEERVVARTASGVVYRATESGDTAVLPSAEVSDMSSRAHCAWHLSDQSLTVYQLGGHLCNQSCDDGADYMAIKRVTVEDPRWCFHHVAVDDSRRRTRIVAVLTCETEEERQVAYVPLHKVLEKCTALSLDMEEPPEGTTRISIKKTEQVPTLSVDATTGEFVLHATSLLSQFRWRGVFLRNLGATAQLSQGPFRVPACQLPGSRMSPIFMVDNEVIQRSVLNRSIFKEPAVCDPFGRMQIADVLACGHTRILVPAPEHPNVVLLMDLTRRDKVSRMPRNTVDFNNLFTQAKRLEERAVRQAAEDEKTEASTDVSSPPEEKLSRRQRRQRRHEQLEQRKLQRLGRLQSERKHARRPRQHAENRSRTKRILTRTEIKYLQGVGNGHSRFYCTEVFPDGQVSVKLRPDWYKDYQQEQRLAKDRQAERERSRTKHK
ncbi:MAG: hypothetical protein MHM6MM_003472 [Cercozoa sp. M6MM]